MLDRFAATLSYNLVVEVMPLASSLQGRATDPERERLPWGLASDPGDARPGK